MEKGAIESALKAFFEREFPVPGLDLDSDTDLLRTIFVDSLRVVTTALFLEEEFGISVTPSDISVETFETIDKLAELVILKG